MAYEKLPNCQAIDLQQFQVVDIRDAIQEVDNKMLVTITDKVQNKFGNLLAKAEEAKVKATTGFTEAQILADESIWMVSEGDESDNEVYDMGARN